MAINKNIVTDYGADDTGATPSTSALYGVSGFRSESLGEIATLLFPDNGPGHQTYDVVSTGGGLDISWSRGTASLDVTATGATLVNPILGAIGFLDRGIAEPNGVSARIRSVNAGSTTVLLTAASTSAGYISRAVIGNWICVAGFDIQGIFLSTYGVPPNAHFLDYAQITAVGTDPGTGADTITFTPALTCSYSDQWPNFNAGNAFGIDSGGPATVYFMDSGWNGPVTFTGGTYSASGQIGCGGRDFTMNGGETTGNSLLMSTNKSYRAINHINSGLAVTEQDKLNDYVYIEGGSYGQWHCQSSSNRYLELKNTTLTSLNGTAKNTVVDGCTIGSMFIGPVSYGIGETFICRDTSFTGGISGIGAISTNFPSYVTMANGIITMPISVSAEYLRALVPDPYGRNIFFWRTNTTNDTGSSRVLSVTSDQWPPADYQTSTTNVTINNASNILEVSSSIFSPSDVGRVIVVPNGHSSSTFKSVITQYDSATQVRTGENFTNTLAAVSKLIQWGTCNMYVQTNDTGGFPASKLHSGYTSVGIRSSGVRSIYFENCTGTEQAVDLSQAAAQNRPYATYTKRTYTGQMPTAASNGFRLSAAGAVAGTGSKVPATGLLQSIKFNVITPYTGSGNPGALTAGIAQFGININVNGTLTAFNPRINVKIAGERVFLPGQTPTGLQIGDTLPTLAADSWMGGGIDPVLSSSITAEYLGDPSVGPVFTIEIIAEQGQFLGASAVPRFGNLRLHA